MKKRTIVLLIALLFINISILTSCGKHEHTFDEGRVIQEATCTKEGIKEFKCTECEETKQETIKKLDHTIVIDKAVESTCKETGLTEGSHCSVCKEIIKQQKTIDKLEHNYVDGICTVCNTKDPNYVVENASEGLSFELNDSKKGYIVTGIGTCTDTDIIIPSVYNGLPVTNIGDGAFSGCTSLTSITIPNSVTSLGEEAFSYCESLESITIPSSVTSIGYDAFTYCQNLVSITVDENNSVYDSRENCNAIIETSTNTLIVGCKNTTIPNSVASIWVAFNGCTSLTSIIIPSSVTSIGNAAFNGCTSLESITIPNSVTSIEYRAFSFCTSLTNITIPNSVTSIGDMAFSYCTSLESVKFEENSQLTSIGYEAFNNCKNLTSITIPNSVTSIGESTFYNCTSLESVIFGKNSKLASIGDMAFYNCISLTSIELPNSVTSIGDSAFYNCKSLTSIELPNSVTSIGYDVFFNCESLTNITIPSSVKSIGDWAFSYCRSLESIEIPNSVTSIGYAAFTYCPNLTIYCEIESKPSGWDSRWNYNDVPVVWGYTKNE